MLELTNPQKMILDKINRYKSYINDRNLEIRDLTKEIDSSKDLIKEYEQEIIAYKLALEKLCVE